MGTGKRSKSEIPAEMVTDHSALLWRENHRSVVPYVLPFSGRAVFGTAEAER